MRRWAFMVVLCAAGAAQAKGFAEQGGNLVLGTFGFHHASGEVETEGTTSDYDDITDMDLSALYGRFVIDHFLVGGGLEGTWRYRDGGGVEQRATSLAVVLSPAYYLDLSEALFLKAGLPLRYILTGSQDVEAAGAKITTDISGWSVGGEVGLAAPFGVERGGLAEFTVGYDRRTLDIDPERSPESTLTQGIVHVRLGLGLFF